MEHSRQAAALLLSLVLLLIGAPPAAADEPTPNEQQARRIFDAAYRRVFGPQGSTLKYDVNIIGLYKTRGTIWMKGKKQRFTDERVDTWNDGTTAYMAYRKKKIIEIHHANSDKKDKYSGKFKFSLDDFTYHIADTSEGLLITLKQKRSAKGTIKEVKALIHRNTLAPIRLKMRVLFFWATISVSNFQSGGITDDKFVFPRERFGSEWTYEDKRK